MIAACLVWYDEPETFLERCVRSLHGVADELVAVDGRWDGFPGPNHSSPWTQHAAIDQAAGAAGIPARIIDRAKPWGSQVEKRDYAYRTTLELTGADWLFVIDGDEHVTHANPDGLRADLNATDLDVATVYCKRNRGARVPWFRNVRRVFRAVDGLHVTGTHNGVTTGAGRHLAGHNVTYEPALDLRWVLNLEHDANNRGRQRNEQQRRYYAHRYRHRTEAL